MSNNHRDRVLSRLGAHQLTQEETDKILGSGTNFNTFASCTGTLPARNPDYDFDQ